jgi:hypothetical protein
VFYFRAIVPIPDTIYPRLFSGVISSQHPIQKVEGLFIYRISARCSDLQINETLHPYASHGCDSRSGLEKPPGASHPLSLATKLGTMI